MAAPLLDHPRTLSATLAGVLGGRPVDHAGLHGFLSSRADRFLNQLFADGRIAPREAVDALESRPGFVWLATEPAQEELEGIACVAMSGMTATTAAPAVAPSVDAEIVQVRSPADLDAWHEVYCQVFGGDPRGREEWHTIHDALGPGGEESFVLLLARVEGAPAATGGVFFAQDWAGLYCFTTRPGLRGRGLGSALVRASHETARARGVERALLQATPMGTPVYAAAGYREERSLPVLLSS